MRGEKRPQEKMHQEGQRGSQASPTNGYQVSNRIDICKSKGLQEFSRTSTQENGPAIKEPLEGWQFHDQGKLHNCLDLECLSEEQMISCDESGVDESNSRESRIEDTSKPKDGSKRDSKLDHSGLKRKEGKRSGTGEFPAKFKHAGTYGKEIEFHRAWMGLHFDRSGLKTLDGIPLRILNPGQLNLNQGPDFLDAEILLDGNRHRGHVELHLHESEWNSHGHQYDRQYDPVVLHVFLKGEANSTKRADGTNVPCLCLEGRIRPSLGPLVTAGLPCGGFGKQNLPADPVAWLEEAGLARMKTKAAQLQEKLRNIHYDWSQLVWEELAVSLGGPVNGDSFRTLAQKAPWSVVRKYVHSRTCLEAILFGQAGMLGSEPLDHYQRELQDNWLYLKAKHGLRQATIPIKFHRMRPAGFPTTRLAQLAMLAESYRPLCQLLEKDAAIGFLDAPLEIGDYWATRHDFGNNITERCLRFGKDTRQRLAMNVLAPMGILGWREAHLTWDSGHVSSDGWRVEQVGTWLKNLPPEGNQITRKFAALGLVPRNALQAQGMIGIFKNSCTQLKCLKCEVGEKFLGRSN